LIIIFLFAHSGGQKIFTYLSISRSIASSHWGSSGFEFLHTFHLIKYFIFMIMFCIINLRNVMYMSA